MVIDTLVAAFPLVLAFTGIYLVFLLRNDFDLTVDGSFATGGAVLAILVTNGVPVIPAMLASLLAGACLGLTTTLLHALLRIPVFLAGLMMSIALYSINLRILGGLPTLSLIGESTIFSSFDDLSQTSRDWAVIGLTAAIVVGVLGILVFLLKTEVGLAMRAAGMNSAMARSNAVSDKQMVGVALLLANALAALSGAIVVQNQGFMDVGMGRGVVIAGLGAVLIGAVVVRPSSSTMVKAMIAVVVGTVLYQGVLVSALRIGLPPTDLNLATAVTLVLTLAAYRLSARFLPSRRGQAEPELMRAGAGTDLLKSVTGRARS